MVDGVEVVLKVIEGIGCRGCSASTSLGCDMSPCDKVIRDDKKGVIFQEVKQPKLGKE